MDKLSSGNEAYAIAFESVNTPGKEALVSSNKVITGTSTGIYILERVATRITRIIMVQQADIGGSIPKWLMNTQITFALSIVLAVQEKYRRKDRTIDKVSVFLVIFKGCYFG